MLEVHRPKSSMVVRLWEFVASTPAQKLNVCEVVGLCCRYTGSEAQCVRLWEFVAGTQAKKLNVCEVVGVCCRYLG